MSASEPVCDFCYTAQRDWEFKADCLPRPWLGWKFTVCDSCRLLLRNVIGPALHRLTHTEVTSAIIQAMNQRGITYEDLMKPMLELTAASEKHSKPIE